MRSGLHWVCMNDGTNSVNQFAKSLNGTSKHFNKWHSAHVRYILIGLHIIIVKRDNPLFLRYSNDLASTTGSFAQRGYGPPQFHPMRLFLHPPTTLHLKLAILSFPLHAPLSATLNPPSPSPLIEDFSQIRKVVVGGIKHVKVKKYITFFYEKKTL